MVTPDQVGHCWLQVRVWVVTAAAATHLERVRCSRAVACSSFRIDTSAGWGGERHTQQVSHRVRVSSREGVGGYAVLEGEVTVLLRGGGGASGTRGAQVR